MKPLRIGLLLGVLSVGILALARDRDPIGFALFFKPAPAPPAPTHLFVVLDTVRADTTSLCGFEHPTTPTLEALATRPGAVHSCRAYVPGSWTLPTHASFFTGRPVLEHGAHFFPGHDLGIGLLAARGLDDSLPTLAEELAARGYQTVAVSGNPVVGEESGLVRGFEHLRTGPLGTLENDRLVEEIHALLPELDSDRPLFLFLNLAEAHSVLDEVPPGHPWLEAQAPMGSEMLYWEQPIEDRDAFARGYRTLYEYGVQRADRTLGEALALLESAGWLGPDSRIVVTTDHGEVLGEHGMFGHRATLWEGNNRSFLVAVGFEDLQLPTPVSALEVHALLRDGALAGHPVEAVAFHDEELVRRSGGTHGVGSWTGRWADMDKYTWHTDRGVQHVDLAADPGEAAPAPATDPRVEALAAELQGLDFSGDEVDPALVEMLRAAGYVE